MPINLKGRHFLTLNDFTSREIRYLLDLSLELRNNKLTGIKGHALEGKNIVLIFDKSSTRTRCSFEIAARDEGAGVTYLSNSHMGDKESIEDTAKVLGCYYDGIEYRGFDHANFELMAKHAGVPVWNGLSDKFHPTQILADFLTLEEHLYKPLRDMKFVFVGDARNNMGNSLMIGCAKMGMHFVGLAPKQLFPNKALVEEAKKIAKDTGAKIEFQDDIDKAVRDADVLYTDVWVSMGEEDLLAKRIKMLKPYQINMEMLKKTRNDKILFMHCLPACHDTNTDFGKMVFEKFGLKEMEVTDEVFRSRHSIVFDQAENRMHTIKAIMVATIGDV
ncbi:MAG: ornithine carbamoyltransferase [Pseudomonadota bacterium]|nr:ornithine carbamoyltransferase [Gammaproteobacteria bacterium]MBU1558279.1 ornithine carbamoyltransferase [Gammaproteobacteria bacterium]MBU1926172.1 ornithine carbamoyltransferase [Gammaproteobacteria bacterium]MBU2546571.1 ornithine carbamoyltransferase [Gammaproteobacteria bacterium]